MAFLRLLVLLFVIGGVAHLALRAMGVHSHWLWAIHLVPVAAVAIIAYLVN